MGKHLPFFNMPQCEYVDVVIWCGCEVVKPSGRKRRRPTVAAAVEMAQAIARSRLHDYSSTPLLVRLHPATASTCSSSWIDDDYRRRGGSGRSADDDDGGVEGAVGRVAAYCEKKLLIAPPRNNETNRADEHATRLSGCK